MGESKQTEIGRVQEGFVGIEDHGIFAIAVKVKCASCFQGYGHFAIDDYDPKVKRRVGSAVGCEVLRRLHAFFGVSELRYAVGQAIVVERDDGAFGDISRLRRLDCDGGAIFDVKAIFAEYAKGEAP